MLPCWHLGLSARPLQTNGSQGRYIRFLITPSIRRQHTDTNDQVVTDRFARSDNATSPCDTSQRVHCGGTWKGITTHLDYIQDLGFDAVWISPVVKNIEQTTPYGEAYHGLVLKLVGPLL